MKKFFENKPRAWFVIGSILVLIITAISVFLVLGSQCNNNEDALNDPEVLAVVGENRITLSDLNARIYGTNLIGSPDNPLQTTPIEKQAFLDELIEGSIITQEASKNNIQVDQKDVEIRAASIIKTYSSMTDIEKEYIIKNRTEEELKNKFKEALIKRVTGEYILFRFDKYYLFGEKDFEGEGDVEKVKAQKIYAKTLAEAAYTDLISGNITFEQATKNLIEDKEIGFEASKPNTPNFFGDFTGKEYSDRVSYFDKNSYKGLYEEVAKMKKDEISRPILVSGYTGSSKLEGMNEVFYAIVKVNEINGGIISNEYSSYDDWLSSKKLEYKVKAYYKKLDSKLENKEYANNNNALTFSVAKAAESVNCTSAFVGTHYTAYDVYAYYVGRDGIAHSWPGFRTTIGAGPYTKKSLKGSNADCSNVAHEAYSDAGRYAYNSGRMYSAWAGTTDSGGYSQAHLAACGESSTGRIYFHNFIPSLSGDDPAQGSWEFVTSTYNSYGIKGETYDSKWLNNNNTMYSYLDGNGAGMSLYVPLNMGASGNWANGTTITKRAVYIPKWSENFNLTVNISPTAAATATGAGSYAEGSSATAGYTNVSADYEFSNWSGDAGCGSAMTMNGNKTCTANFTRRLTDVSCSVSPETGLSPLVVRINFSGGVPPYTVSTDGYTFADRTSPLYYTFGSAGEKTITVSDSNSTTRDCVVPVTVNNPTNTDGGEVAP